MMTRCWSLWWPGVWSLWWPGGRHHYQREGEELEKVPQDVLLHHAGRLPQPGDHHHHHHHHHHDVKMSCYIMQGDCLSPVSPIITTPSISEAPYTVTNIIISISKITVTTVNIMTTNQGQQDLNYRCFSASNSWRGDESSCWSQTGRADDSGGKRHCQYMICYVMYYVLSYENDHQSIWWC